MSTTDEPTRGTQTPVWSFTAPASLIRALDVEAARRGVKRSVLLRAAIAAYVQNSNEAPEGASP